MACEDHGCQQTTQAPANALEDGALGIMERKNEAVPRAPMEPRNACARYDPEERVRRRQRERGFAPRFPRRLSCPGFLLSLGEKTPLKEPYRDAVDINSRCGNGHKVALLLVEDARLEAEANARAALRCLMTRKQGSHGFFVFKKRCERSFIKACVLHKI